MSDYIKGKRKLQVKALRTDKRWSVEQELRAAMPQTGIMSGIETAAAKGWIQKMRTESLMNAMHNAKLSKAIRTQLNAADDNIYNHLINPPHVNLSPDYKNGDPYEETPQGPNARFSATPGLDPEMLHHSEDSAVVGKPGKFKNKVLVKMYTEPGCDACRKYTMTYLKEMLAAKGVGDIVDLEIVPFGQALVDLKPTIKDLELDPKAKASQHPLDSLAEVKPVAEKMENAVKKYLAMKELTLKDLPPQVKFQCPSGFSQCSATGWEACLQKVSPRHQQYFPTFECIEARSCTDSIKPPACVADPQAVVKRCVDNHGLLVCMPVLLLFLATNHLYLSVLSVLCLATNHLYLSVLPVLCLAINLSGAVFGNKPLRCVDNHGFHVDQAQLESCYEGNEMVSLLLNNDVQTLEAKPMWLPWFTVRSG